MNRKTLLKIVYASLLALVFLAPITALALATPRPEVGGAPVTISEVEAIIRRVAQFLIVISMVVAVIFIIWGGIIWMTAAGNDDRAAKGKSTIWSGIKGAAVVLAVGVILNTLAAIFTRDVLR
ncbi:MAG: hypothetical protein KW806_03500 [Candidatus Yanofskybacteria bacterium]|nr:hypothetical protein [Candidatus Yanofskybacteria bacterium]